MQLFMPKVVDSEQYRRELLSKCFDLFAHKGYATVTTRQLAQELGVSTGTLYHYFPSKAVLFQQLVEQLMRRDFLMAQAELQGAETFNQRFHAIKQFLVKNEDYFIKQMFIWVEFCQQQTQNELQNSEFFQDVYERYQKAITILLGITEPRIIWFVLCMIDGIIIERLCGNTKVSLAEQVDLLGQMLTSYLKQANTP